jgi:hypothetical protein
MKVTLIGNNPKQVRIRPPIPDNLTELNADELEAFDKSIEEWKQESLGTELILTTSHWTLLTQLLSHFSIEAELGYLLDENNSLETFKTGLLNADDCAFLSKRLRHTAQWMEDNGKPYAYLNTGSWYIRVCITSPVTKNDKVEAVTTETFEQVYSSATSLKITAAAPKKRFLFNPVFVDGQAFESARRTDIMTMYQLAHFLHQCGGFHILH